MPENKEICYLPGIDEQVPLCKAPMINTIPGLIIPVGDSYIHAIVPDDFMTAGTIYWQTGDAQNLRPETSPLHRFAGWDT